MVRLRSADLLHSFAIPLLRIGPVDVPAGHTVEVKFDANRPGVLIFCAGRCAVPTTLIFGAASWQKAVTRRRAGKRPTGVRRLP